jgi:HAD superfamily hydrolase (TIGR01549 family)
MIITSVIFDLDGTLTRPYLDFNQIRREIGNVDGPILEAMARMPENQRCRAQSILDAYEREAAEESQLNPGAAELLETLRNQNRPIGLLTRNSRASVKMICEKHNLTFDAISTREDDGPDKPDPYPFLKICETLQVQAAQALMVGDYLFDLLCGKNAGAKTILIRTNKDHQDYIDLADFAINHLSELSDIIKQLENHPPPTIDISDNIIFNRQ